MIEIVALGAPVTVQDLGRTGRAALGVPPGGAFDRGALALANRLVGNAPGDAGLEITLGGLVLRALDAVTVALSGALLDGPLGWGTAVTLPRGATVDLGRPVGGARGDPQRHRGLRSYLGVRGGVDVAAVLGSRATDTLSGLGPAPLRAGDRLPVGVPAHPLVPGALAAPPRVDRRALRVRFGPRADWFTTQAREVLTSATWTVRADSDRVGVRLDGPRLDRVRAGELPSEATLPGALQVPPDGRPIVFGPDAPVTGGYPVIAVLTGDGLDRVAQLRPGDGIRFVT